ncbi:MAG: HD domain-containing protein [Blautia sp.]|nr:HD domain-containing protein [Blautia sp.]
MIPVFYASVFAASLLFAGVYMYMWHKHFDVNFTMVFTLVPIACLGYLLSSVARTRSSAITAQQIIYIGGTFLQLFIVFSIFNLCQVNLPRWVRTMLFAACTAVYLSVLTIGHMDIFYRSVSFAIVDGVPVLTKEYGFMHTVFYVLACSFLLVGIITIVYSWLRKKEVPRRVLLLIIIPDLICVLTFFVVLKVLGSDVDLVSLGYVVSESIFLLIAYRVNLYDVSDTVIDSYVQERKVGYVSFDFRQRYLGSNDVAKELVPELMDTAVDELFGYKPSQRKIRHFLEDFKENPENNTFVYTVHTGDENPDDERIYNVNVNYLYDGNRKRGYIITFIDDTANKKYVRLLDTYNEKLQKEVEEKTGHIVEMHDNLIMSLAMMVESRDNSTGGHIKRTSEGVRILTDEIRKEGSILLSEEFCKDVIKAAPLHDLGKIAVDDAVLRKPGRFTAEEYELMKSHAAEGARVTHEILIHTDDESFKTVAENAAHYHHERWDGQGYPDHISGEEIPLEARIMAIADVYDALVSKRVYKEAFGFEKANAIILEGMGTQFDPALKTAYEHARPRLEAYYRNVS